MQNMVGCAGVTPSARTPTRPVSAIQMLLVLLPVACRWRRNQSGRGALRLCFELHDANSAECLRHPLLIFLAGEEVRLADDAVADADYLHGHFHPARGRRRPPIDDVRKAVDGQG